VRLKKRALCAHAFVGIILLIYFGNAGESSGVQTHELSDVYALLFGKVQGYAMHAHEWCLGRARNVRLPDAQGHGIAVIPIETPEADLNKKKGEASAISKPKRFYLLNKVVVSRR
jgi:hypothetical protein